MKEFSLIEAMGMITYSNDYSDYLIEICEVLGEKGSDVKRMDIDKILSEYNVKCKDIKEELLEIIVCYASIIVQNGIISKNEGLTVKYLKRLFKIKEGDFFKLKEDAIRDIIQQQLYKLYLDKSIDKKEALFKVELQELFDLSYDQMLLFVNPIAYDAIERGAILSDLDTVFPNFYSTKK